MEHIKLHEKSGDKEFVVVFDFLGKDSIRYYNEVSVEKRVFRNLELFMENKQDGDDLFDRLNVSFLALDKRVLFSMCFLSPASIHVFGKTIKIINKLNNSS